MLQQISFLTMLRHCLSRIVQLSLGNVEIICLVGVRMICPLGCLLVAECPRDLYWAHCISLYMRMTYLNYIVEMMCI